ncbi:SRPBCC family protein [Citricoccus nitrophenolicus]
MTEPAGAPPTDLTELSFTVTGRIARPVTEVYESVADPDQLSRYFTTGGAQGRLESGTEVTWDFADFPGAFPVEVVEATAPQRIVLRWDGESAVDESGMTTVAFTFSPLDGDTRTLVSITESSWHPTQDGARNAFGNCMGWTGMLAAMKAWVEHGINLRDGFYT